MSRSDVTVDLKYLHSLEDDALKHTKLRVASREVLRAFERHIEHSPTSYGMLKAVTNLQSVLEEK